MIREYAFPSDIHISYMIAALLLKLTNSSTSVSYLFHRWLEIIEKRDSDHSEVIDEINTLKDVCNLYSRAVKEQPTLSVRALKTLLKL